MTSTPVKDVGSILTNLTPGAGSKAAGIGQTGFQTVLNNQTQKGADAETRTGKPVTDRKSMEDRTAVKPGESLKTKDSAKLHTDGTDVADGVTEEEMSPEELEAVMEVLETAAVQLIQQTADALGISVEEVQAVMEELGMEQLDVLDRVQLGTLFLQASGAEDSYALVTDEGLYEDYQGLMKQLDAALQESGQALEIEPEKLQGFLGKIREQMNVSENVPEVKPDRETDATAEGREPDLQETVVRETADVSEENSAATESKPQSGEQGQKETGSDKGQGANLFIQNLKTESFQPQVQQTTELSSPWDADTENIMKQIMDYMKIQLKADTSNLEMQLHPASLGTVQVQIAAKGGVVTANFIAQNEAVKSALESQMVQLIERFDEQGVKVEAIEVTVQTHEFERNLDQGRGGSQGEPTKKNRTRKINLNDSLSMENMEEEDALAADMLAANGNTVDYTA